MLVYVEGSQKCLEDVFIALGFTVIKTLSQEVDLIVLQGGADINPSWYQAYAHPRTSWSDKLDKITASLTEFAFQNKIPIVGICRGAQFINAVLGGSMYQHVDNHQQYHDLVDLKTGQEYYVNSIHHQMMIPHISAEIVAVAKGPVANLLQTTTEYGTIKSHVVTADTPEVEALWYKDFKALCFQAHPEYASPNSPTRLYFNSLMERYFPQFFQEKVA